MVTVVGAVPSQIEAGLIEAIVGAASSTAAFANEALGPFASVRIAEHVEAAVPVAVKLAVAVVEDVSVKLLKAKVLAPVHVVATPTPMVAPLSAKPDPVKAAVPVEPAALTPVEFAVAP
jgi:hypothetical protein